MKVSKWVDMGQEVEIEVGVEDIRGALAECFARVTDDNYLGEREANRAEISMAFSTLAEFLRAVSERQIDMLTHEQRRIIKQFLVEQGERYSARGLPAEGDSAK